MSINPINTLSSSYLPVTVNKSASPSNRLAAPSNGTPVSFAQMLGASASGKSSSGTPVQTLTQAMSSFHASGIKDQEQD